MKEYPCWINGKIEMTLVSELSEEYKRSQIRYHKRKIRESQDLISLLS